MYQTADVPTTTAVDVLTVVTSAYQVSREQIESRIRTERVASARSMVAAILYHQMGFSCTAIGRLLLRDHSTVLHAVRVIDRDERQRETYEALTRELAPYLAGVPIEAAVLDVLDDYDVPHPALVHDYIVVDVLAAGRDLPWMRLPRLVGLDELRARPLLALALTQLLDDYGEYGAAELLRCRTRRAS